MARFNNLLKAVVLTMVALSWSLMTPARADDAENVLLAQTLLNLNTAMNAPAPRSVVDAPPRPSEPTAYPRNRLGLKTNKEMDEEYDQGFSHMTRASSPDREGLQGVSLWIAQGFLVLIGLFGVVAIGAMVFQGVQLHHKVQKNGRRLRVMR